ncbi:MAG: Sua5/YciO/YrdC/YwlC family protein [Gemmatimonadetes bacterium]|nr:Sua5/YciO/YrdC/YwlC family protein [Gemmatimonadota bacterium]
MWPDGAGGGAPELVATGERAVTAAAAALDDDTVLVHPTVTVYGLGARPGAERDARIARLKRRAPGPLIALARDRRELDRAIPDLSWPPKAERLAEAFWPGPLTMVLGGSSGSTWAVRVDSHPAVQAVLQLAGGLMTSTSMNVSGRPPARTRADVVAAAAALAPVDGRLGWLDAADLDDAAPSTMVRIERDEVAVLRDGAIARGDVYRAITEGTSGPTA